MSEAPASGTTGSGSVSAERLFEAHSIDYIPRAERHGKAWHQATFWFAGNAELATLAVGLLGISLGLSLFWDLVAVTLGLAFGTLFMASHSVQGPRLGIPQMIQSRPQFGYYGALLPQAIVVALYVGFNVFNMIISGQAIAALTPLSTNQGIVLSAVLGFAIAFGGYNWLHFFQRWGTWVFLVLFGFFTIGVMFTVHLPKAQSGVGDFQITPFMVVLLASAAYVVSEAPYVSDYSRYLGPGESARACFWWTYVGSGLGSLWMIGLGSFLLAAYPELSTVEVVRAGGNTIFTGFGGFALFVAWVMMIPIISTNMYGGSLTVITVADSVRSIKPTRNLRLATLIVVGLASVILALSLSQNFLTDYSNFLTILLYFLIPWTAVNLVDFYVVRRGDYAIGEIFNKHGIYGLWQWRGLAAYAVGFVAMIPFFSTAYYTGAIARRLDGTDLSIFVGLPLAALVYYALARNVDRTQEVRLSESNEVEVSAPERARPAPAT